MDSKGCMKIPEYIDTYEELFAPLKDKPVTILELGVLSGASLLMWDAYFPHPQAEIVGLDMNPPIDFNTALQLKAPLSRIFQYQGQQDDRYLLECIVHKHGPFDIIIDDASHRRGPTETSLTYLFTHVKPGGYYIIEDFGTGYWVPERGFDGEHYQGANTNHSAGMVGLVKSFVDEISSMDLPEPYTRQSPWLSLEVRWGQAILRLRKN